MLEEENELAGRVFQLLFFIQYSQTHRTQKLMRVSLLLMTYRGQKVGSLGLFNDARLVCTFNVHFNAKEGKLLADCLQPTFLVISNFRQQIEKFYVLRKSGEILGMILC